MPGGQEGGVTDQPVTTSCKAVPASRADGCRERDTEQQGYLCITWGYIEPRSQKDSGIQTHKGSGTHIPEHFFGNKNDQKAYLLLSCLLHMYGRSYRHTWALHFPNSESLISAVHVPACGSLMTEGKSHSIQYHHLTIIVPCT